MAETTPLRSPSSGKGGRQSHPGKQGKSSSVTPVMASAAEECDSSSSAESQPGPVPKVPFWAMAGFLGLYGLQQVPQIQELGAVWHTGLTDGGHTLAVGLGFYFTAEIGKRVRAWFSSKVHVRLEGSIRLGEQKTADQESRGS